MESSDMATPNPQVPSLERVEPASLIGRDEMNLAEFPIALLADFAPKGQKTLYYEGGNGGRLTPSPAATPTACPPPSTPTSSSP
jgi:hypothetical protein